MNVINKNIMLASILGGISGIVMMSVINHYNESFEPEGVTGSMRLLKEDTGGSAGSEKLDSLFQSTQQQMRRHDSKIQNVERKLSDLTALLDSERPSVEAQQVQDQARELNEITPEEARARDLAWWDGMKTNFEQEPVDREWSEKANADFVTDISQLANEKGFSLLYTECKTSQCRATLEWSSFDEASIGFSDLLHHQYQSNCARYTLLPEPTAEDIDNPYQMSIIFDCSETKESS